MKYDYSLPYALTPTELKILKKAYESGYFEHGKTVSEKPSMSSISQMAKELGYDQPTFSRYLANARRKILSSVCKQIFEENKFVLAGKRRQNKK